MFHCGFEFFVKMFFVPNKLFEFEFDRLSFTEVIGVPSLVTDNSYLIVKYIRILALSLDWFHLFRFKFYITCDISGHVSLSFAISYNETCFGP